jgi:hypothetical protein
MSGAKPFSMTNSVRRPPLRQRVQHHRQRRQHEDVVQAQVVPRAAGVVHRQEEVSLHPRVIVHEETAQPRDRPARRRAQRQRVEVRAHRLLEALEVDEDADERPKHAAHRRQAFPEARMESPRA